MQSLRSIGKSMQSLRPREGRRPVRWAAGIGAGAAVWMGVAAWAEGALNKKVVPFAAAEASGMMGRAVRPGRVKLGSPLGLVGLGPILKIKQCSLGPQIIEDSDVPVERSVVEVEEVQMGIMPGRSAAERRAILGIELVNATVTLRQLPNRSWLGYPDDWKPSARPRFTEPPEPAKDRAKRRRKQQQLGKNESSGNSNASAAPVSVGQVSLRRGVLSAEVHGDPEPRRVWPLKARFVGSSDGEWRMHVTGVARHRTGESVSWTFKHPEAATSLRRAKMEGEERARVQREAKAADEPAGRIEVAGRIGTKGDADLTVSARELEATVLESLLDVPVDLHGGYAEGDVRVAVDPAKRIIPHLEGLVKAKDVCGHIHDSPDVFHSGQSWVSLEGQQVSLLHTSAHFGSIPVEAGGSINLAPKPQDGSLSIAVRATSPVPVNDLRETLGVKPTPRPVEGDAKGEILVGGSIARPVISGRAAAFRPADRRRLEETARLPVGWAAGALLADPEARLSYDRVVIGNAQVTFSLDPNAGIFRLHEADLQPARGGGSARAYGAIRTKPEDAWKDDAVDIAFRGRGLSAAALMEPYEEMAVGARARASQPAESFRELLLGDQEGSVDVAGSMRGPQMAPRVSVEFGGAAEGSVEISRQGIAGHVRGHEGKVEGSSRVATRFPSPERQRTAVTPDEAIRLATPTIERVQADVAARGADLTAFLPAESELARALPTVGARLRLTADGKPWQTGGFDGWARLEEAAGFNSLSLAPGGAAGPVRVYPSGAAELALETRGGRGKSKGGLWARKSAGEGSVRFSCGDVEGRAESIPGGGVVASLVGVALDDLDAGSLRGTLERAEGTITASGGKASVAIAEPRAGGLAGERLEAEGNWGNREAALERLLVMAEGAEYELEGRAGPAFGDGSAVAKLRGGRVEHLVAAWRLAEEVAEVATLGKAGGARKAARERFREGAKRLGLSVDGRSELARARRFARILVERLQAEEEEAREDQEEGGDEDGNKRATIRRFGKVPAAKKTSSSNKGGGGASRVPNWLEGRLDGEVKGSAKGGHPERASFDVEASGLGVGGFLGEGERVAAHARGEWSGKQMAASLEDASVSLEQAGGRADMRGQLGGSEQATAFQVVDVPAAALRRLAEGVTGQDVLAGKAVAGALYANGGIRGSWEAPQGEVRARLVDGALGDARLAHAEASLEARPDGRAELSALAAPASADGHLTCEAQGPAPGPGRSLTGREPVQGRVRARGSGVPALVQALGPSGLTWEGGNAEADGSLSGTLGKPEVEARVGLSRAQVRWPAILGQQRVVVSLSAGLRDGGSTFHVDSLDARVGRRGRVSAKGSLPLSSAASSPTPSSTSPGRRSAQSHHHHQHQQHEEEAAGWETLVRRAEEREGVRLEWSGVELRGRGTLSGRVDGALGVRGSVQAPTVSGRTRLSRGTAVVNPQLFRNPRGGGKDASAARGKRRRKEGAEPQGLSVEGFELTLGPGMRVVLPLVLTVSVEGNVRADLARGAEKPALAGEVRLPHGSVNLVAAEARLDPGYPNRAAFQPEHELDPELDLCLLAPSGTRALLQGRASRWSALSRGGEVWPWEEGAAAAPALRALASRTLEHLLPRLETQGRLGRVRWRASGSPSVPALALGTELEAKVGDRLTASLSRRPRGSSMNTHWSVHFLLSPHSRVLLDSQPPHPARALVEISSEPFPRLSDSPLPAPSPAPPLPQLSLPQVSKDRGNDDEKVPHQDSPSSA